MTPSELKHHVEAAGHEPYFFQRKTMAFFGDTMRNYGVRARLIMSDYDRAGTYVEGGSPILVWELYRKRPVKHGLQSSAFFEQESYRQTFERK